MPLSATCPHCAAKFRADERFAGRTAKCPKCTQPFQLPAAVVRAGESRVAPGAAIAAATAASAAPMRKAVIVTPARPAAARTLPPTREQLGQKILAGFTGPIRRPRTPITYQLAAIVVALLMVLLPVIYLGVIALTGYAVYYHAVNHTAILTSVRGRAAVFALLLYAAPIVVGVVLILFMIKPLFAPAERGGRTRSLRREAEPLLFAFVDRICETVGAPRPKQIDVDCDVNASARFRRGVLSMFGRDLVLTIGMPLVAGLNTRQFAGVLAHEFGHFSQGFGMRLSYFIRSLSHWFMRVVYQRDAADEWLQQTAAEADLRFGWVLYLAMGFVWLSRRVLWMLMYVGHFFGSFLLRQMEFDADRYETRLAGSRAFEQTARQLLALDVAAQGAYADLCEFYREGRLGDDLPRLIIERVRALPPEAKQAIDKLIATQKTGVFDTHPCDGDRIVAAKREDTDGVFQVELPASVLLTNFEASSKAATVEFYRGAFGNSFDPKQLRPVAVIVAKNKQARESGSSLERFFVGEWSAAAPLSLGSYFLEASKNPAECLAGLKSVRAEMTAKVESVRGSTERLHAALSRMHELQQLSCLLRAHVKLKKQTLAEAGGADGVKRSMMLAERDIEKAAASLRRHSDLAAKRIVLDLQLLHVPKVAARLPEPRPDVRRVSEQFDALRIVSEALHSLPQISRQHGSLGALVEVLQNGGRQDDIVPIVEDLMQRQLPLAKQARGALERGHYPYEHAKGRVSLAQFVMPDVPVKNDLGSLYNSCAQLIDAGPTLYSRLLGEIVHIAEMVETACGLAKPDAAAKEPAAVS